MSPEVINGQKNGYSFEADWWAFGVLLYQMYTRKLPFIGNDPMEIYKNILDNRTDY